MKIVILFGAAMAFVVAQNPLSDDVRRAYAETKRNIVRSAEKMPAESYNFRPAPRVRSFGELIGHVAQEHCLFFCGPVKGENKAVDIEKTKTTKVDLIAAIKESFAYCDAVYDGMTDVEAVKIVTVGGSTSTKLRLLWMNITHDELHYGNMVTYLRMKKLFRLQPRSNDPDRDEAARISGPSRRAGARAGIET